MNHFDPLGMMTFMKDTFARSTYESGAGADVNTLYYVTRCGLVEHRIDLGSWVFPDLSGLMR